MIDIKEAIEKIQDFVTEHVSYLNGYPILLRKRPKFWQFSFRRYDNFILSEMNNIGFNITDIIRERWYSQSQSQYREDAGGYILRKWIVALGYDQQEFEKAYYD